jgi:gamma-glutamyltranspeptidase/glutathione hydrolase
MGRKGMVASGHALASQAGISILQKGGNAVDAAVVVAAALNVVEPLMSGIGGDGFIMVYMKDKDDLKVVNATGAAPMASSRERYLPKGIPLKGIHSVSVPGLLMGWTEAHHRYGNLKLEEVLEPAVDLAAGGFPVSHVVSRAIAADELLCQFPTSRAIFTRNGRPLAPGEILYQKDLARTFRQIGSQGAEAFYQGEIAQKMVDFIKDEGGLLTGEDMIRFKVRWQEAISTNYRGHTVYEAPPNSSGHILLQELNLVEGFDLKALGCNNAQSVHIMAEAKKLAFADREAYLADPEFVEVPVPGLLSKEYAAERAKGIDPERATADVRAGDPWRYQEPRGRKPRAISRVSSPREDTTCFTVVDQWGNAVSQLQSLQSTFGSSLVAGDTGILLNNRMSYWHLDKDHVDTLQPGKRVRHTMNPVMVFRRGQDGGRDLVLVCGTPGADTQVQTNLQVITHVLDFGMTVAEAVEAPRWRHLQDGTESTYPHNCDDEIWLEGRFSPEVRRGLEARGHALKILGDWEGTGSEMMIQVDSEEGALHGAADPRRDGYALGW